MNKKSFLVSIIGGHECNEETADIAEHAGRIIAEEGCVLVSGGLKGVMEAACRGAKKADGVTIGILPGRDKNDANEFVDIVITTGIWHARNVIVAAGTDIVVAFAGKYGTLSEIGFALNKNKTVVGIGAWDIPQVVKVDTPEEAMHYIRQKVT